MSTPDTTVVVLTCNRTRFIAEALASVRAQTASGWTLLLSDTSTDASAQATIAAEFDRHVLASPDNTSRLFRPATGLPQAHHLAAAFAEVHTPYIALLDDDDVWMPRHLALAHAWLELNPRRGLTVASSVFIDENGIRGDTDTFPGRTIPPDHAPSWCLDYLLRYPFSSTSGIVLRAGVLRDHRFFVTSCVDVHLCVSALLAGARVGLRTEPSFFYRVHAASSYAKGPQAHYDRHRLRLHLATQRGWELTRRVPHFPLLALKSAACVLLASVRSRFTRPASHRTPPAPYRSTPAAHSP